MSSAAVGAGSVLSGRYRLVEPLASGGMGTVWRALDLLLDRPVAVKEVRLPPGLGRRRARVAAPPHDPGGAGRRPGCGTRRSVTIYDVVEQDGRPWIVMELVPSRSLAEIIRTAGRCRRPGSPRSGCGCSTRSSPRPPPGSSTATSSRRTCWSRDEGRVVLTDFGIARHVGDETLTSAGLIVGSPDYLAPERARGRTGGLAADLWSLGATMYDAVEGRRPFERNGPLPTLAAVVHGRAGRRRSGPGRCGR